MVDPVDPADDRERPVRLWSRWRLIRVRTVSGILLHGPRPHESGVNAPPQDAPTSQRNSSVYLTPETHMPVQQGGAKHRVTFLLLSSSMAFQATLITIECLQREPTPYEMPRLGVVIPMVLHSPAALAKNGNKRAPLRTCWQFRPSPRSQPTW